MESKNPVYRSVNEEFLSRLNEIFNPSEILTDLIARYPYSMDGTLFNPSTVPEVVVLPHSVEQVCELAKLCHVSHVPLTVRGSGTSLSGGPLPLFGGVVVDMRYFNRIQSIDIANNIVIVEAGVICDDLNAELDKHGYFFPPDPGSSSAATIGGMVGNNAGGIQAFKYGVTSHYVIWLEVVLATGEKVEFGSLTLKSTSSFNLVGLMVGSEGQLGIITRIGLKIKPKPPFRKTAFFIFKEFASIPRVVEKIRRNGIVPNMLEFLDKTTTRVCFEYLGGEYLTYPEGYFFLLEIDGEASTVEEEFEKVRSFCIEEHPLVYEIAKDEEDRDRIVDARKSALPALSRLAPTTTIEDCTINLSHLSKAIEMLEGLVDRLGESHLKIATFGHLEGNLHPTFLFNEHIKKDVEDFEKALHILYEEIVLPLGGTITGEHGVGLIKSPFISLEHESSLVLMHKIKKLLDPHLILNPGKGKGMQISQEEVNNPAALPYRDMENVPPISCMRCGFCVYSCPSYLYFRKEVYSPRGKLALLKGLLRKDLSVSNELIDIWYACTLCGACAEKCPALVDTIGLFEGTRLQIIDFINNPRSL